MNPEIHSYRPSARSQNHPSIISKLPPETLCQIIRAYQDSLSPGSQRTPRYNTTEWIVTTHVCRKWRQTLINAPQLWAIIPVHRSVLATEMILRAKGALLTLRYMPLHHEPTEIPDHLLRCIISSPQALARVEEIVVMLHPAANGRAFQRNLLATAIPAPMPKLRVLKVDLNTKDDEEDTHPAPSKISLTFFLAACLARGEVAAPLQRLDFSNPSSLPRQLFVPSLQHLGIFCDQSPYLTARTLEILASLPHLEVLRLVGFSQEDTHHAIAAVGGLPRLRALRLERFHRHSPPNAQHVLDLLERLPNLEDLAIDHFPEVPLQDDQVRDLIKRVPNLRRLRLGAFPQASLTNSQVLILLNGLSHLRVLDVGDSRGDIAPHQEPPRSSIGWISQLERLALRGTTKDLVQILRRLTLVAGKVNLQLQCAHNLGAVPQDDHARLLRLMAKLLWNLEGSIDNARKLRSLAVAIPINSGSLSIKGWAKAGRIRDNDDPDGHELVSLFTSFTPPLFSACWKALRQAFLVLPLEDISTLCLDVDDAIGDWFEPSFILYLLAQLPKLRSLRIQGSLLHSFLVGMLPLQSEFTPASANLSIDSIPLRNLRELGLCHVDLKRDCEARPICKNLQTFLAQRKGLGISIEKLELTNCTLLANPVDDFGVSVGKVEWDNSYRMEAPLHS